MKTEEQQENLPGKGRYKKRGGAPMELDSQRARSHGDGNLAKKKKKRTPGRTPVEREPTYQDALVEGLRQTRG